MYPCKRAHFVSARPCISRDNCRSRKKVRIDLRARSTSPHGRRFVKSIPVNGVTFWEINIRSEIEKQKILLDTAKKALREIGFKSQLMRAHVT